MAFSDTMKVVQRDLSGVIYNGKPLRKSDVLTIDQNIKRIVFKDPLDIKALNFASTTEVILMQHSKISHIMASGRIICLGNLFCGSIESGSDIVVRGDLVSWIGDIDSAHGNIIVSGNLISAHQIIAQQGMVIVNGEVTADVTPESLLFWEGSSGLALPDEAKSVARDASKLIKTITGG